MGACVVHKKGATIKAAHMENEITEESKNSNENYDLHRVLNRDSKDVIKKALKSHYLFSCIKEDELEKIFKEINFWVVSQDSTIFEEGSSGKFFYILEKGSVEVTRNGIKKAVLMRGSTFGDHALLTDAPRSATIRTLEECRLWGIERKTFTKTIQSINEKNIEFNKSIIAKFPIFAEISEEMQGSIAKHLVELNYQSNFRVICEGDKGSLVFIIIKGKAIAKLAGEEKIRLTEGEIFGEEILISDNQVRTLSIYSDGNLKALSISKENVISILGEDFKSLIYRSQGSTCLKTNLYTKMLSKSNHDELLENIHWKSYKPEEVSLRPEHLKDSIFLLCFGNLYSKYKKFNKNDIIGLNDIETIESDELIADSEVILGELKKKDIERICKKSLSVLKSEIKNILFIRKVKMFSQIKLEDLKNLVTELGLRNFDSGEIVYKFNDPAHDLFIVKRGSVEVIDFVTANQVLNRGDVFGQQCISQPLRTQLVRAVTPTICIILPLKKLKSLSLSFQQSTETHLNLNTNFPISQVSVLKPLPCKPPRMAFLSQIHPTQSLTKVTVIKKPDFSNIEKFNKLIQEKKILLKVNSPFAARMQKSFSDSKFVYFFHNYCESVPISSINRKEFSEAFVKQIAASFVVLLQELHEGGIFLRAVALENVEISCDGFLVFSEFRYAKVCRSRTSSVVGDPFYMAPEMLKNQGYSKSVDLWALGILIHQLFYNSFPFSITSKDEPMTIFEKITVGSLIIPENSQFIRGNEVLIKLLQKNPEARLTLKDLKYSTWLDSIDWEGLSNLSIQPIFKPPILSSVTSPRSQKFTPIQQYLNVITIQNSISFSESSLNQCLNLNWDKYF